MISLYLRKMLSLSAAAVMACVATSVMTAATPAAGETVTYTATGTFAATPISGSDQLRLAGEPFTINVVGNSSLAPAKHGSNWAIYNGLSMTGTVYSGLLGAEPISIAAVASIELATSTTEDVLQMAFPVQVIGIDVTVKAYVILPGGTMPNPHIQPFKTTAMGTSSTVTYLDTAESTELGIASGTVGAAGSSGSPSAAIFTTPDSFGADLLQADFFPALLAMKSAYLPAPEVL